MLTPAQVKSDFNKFRDETHEHGAIAVVKFGGVSIRCLKSSKTKTVTIHEYGEDEQELFTLRFLIDDFPTPPVEKDVLDVDGTEYQVGEVRYSGFGQILRAYMIDVD